MDLLRALLYGVSAQRPSHSLYVAGEQLPLEARTGGIFLGVLCATLVVTLLGRLRAGRVPPPDVRLACWVLIILTALDGLNALLYDGGLPHLYAPTTAVRLFTGLGAGVGLAMLAAPVVANVVWRAPLDRAPVERLVELAMALGAAALIGGIILVAPAPLMWPLALVMLLSVVLAFGAANLYLLIGVTGRAEPATRAADLKGPLVSAFGLALIELAALAALRSWLASSLGFTWGL